MTTSSQGWTVQVFFDGECPLCVREIGMLRKLDRRGKILMTDIAAAGFRAEDFGQTQAALMDQIHARLPDGTWITGVEVFRRLYAAVGLGVVSSFLSLPGVDRVADFAYERFAKNRLKWTGRCDANGCALPQAKTS